MANKCLQVLANGVSHASHAQEFQLMLKTTCETRLPQVDACGKGVSAGVILSKRELRL